MTEFSRVWDQDASGGNWSGWLELALHADISSIQIYWDDLPVDPYVRIEQRLRRYSVGQIRGGNLTLLPEEPHIQGAACNSLFGGLKRKFAPIERKFFEEPAFLNAIDEALMVLPVRTQSWRLQFHQFRILAPGAPTPEGVHRDGAAYVLMILVKRHNVSGGETVLYRKDEEQPLTQLTLIRPGQALILDDEMVSHFVTPIKALPGDDTPTYRDMLVVTFHGDNSRA